MSEIYNAKGLLEVLNITSPEDIEDAMELLAPSMAEYFIENSLENIVLSPRSNFIQSIFVMGQYKIIIDYNNDIYVDRKVESNDSTSCLF